MVAVFIVFRIFSIHWNLYVDVFHGANVLLLNFGWGIIIALMSLEFDESFAVEMNFQRHAPRLAGVYE